MDDDAPNDPGPGDPLVSDPDEDGSADHPFDAIQEGIGAAQNGDTVLVLDGTYTGTGNKGLDFAGKAITVRSKNGPDACIIDCEGDGHGFHFHSGEAADATVGGLTVISIGESSFEGRGVNCADGSPVIRDCVFRGTEGGSGRQGIGIRAGQTGAPTIIGCTLIGCRVGIECFGVATIRRCLVASNSSDGGIYCSEAGSLTVTNSAITTNDGSGIEGYGTLTAVDCVITKNHGENGGGIRWSGGPANVVRCTIADNWGAYDGGGICCSGDIQIVDCAIVGNGHGIWGGGVCCLGGGIVRIASCTIAGNLAGGGGGVRVRAGTVTIANCIVWGNIADAGRGSQIAAGPGPGTLSVCYSAVEGGEADIYAWGDVDLTWGEENINTDPIFTAPGYWNGDVWVDGDYHLLPNSPCIDAGCNCAVPPDSLDLDGDGDTAEYTPFDLDGEGRFFDDPNTPDTGSGLPPVVDMGAYEFGNADPPPCFGDLDGDRDVDTDDLLVLLANYATVDGASGVDGDMDCDGDVVLADLAQLLSVYGTVCE